jgi:hypothetical protein
MTVNKYALLSEGDLDTMLDAISNLSTNVRHLFLDEIIQNTPNNKLHELVSDLRYKDYFYCLSEQEATYYLPLLKRMFDNTPAKTVLNNFGEVDEEFFSVLFHSEELLKQYFDTILSIDKKKFTLFNGIMSDIVSESGYLHYPAFSNVFCHYQDKLQVSVIKEALINSTKPLNIYTLLTNETKAILKKSHTEQMGDFIDHLISKAIKKDNLPKVLKENDLLSQVSTKSILTCLKNNKKFLLDSLFTSKQIHDEVQNNFWNIVFINANSSKNYFNLIKQTLSKEEIVDQLKMVIKNGVSLGPFYNQIQMNKTSPQSALSFIEIFYDELKTYLKEDPLTTLEQFITKNAKQIKYDFDHYTEASDVMKEYNNLLIKTQKTFLDKTMTQEKVSSTKKLKI